MKHLRQMLRRYKAGRCVPEKLRGLMLNEIQSMRASIRQVAEQIHLLALSNPRTTSLEHIFERDMNDAVRNARVAQFDAAWHNILSASRALNILEEMWMAGRIIEQFKDRLRALDDQFRGAIFASLPDYKIFLSRALVFYDQQKYRTARFIANECKNSLDRLTAASPQLETPPPDLLRRIQENDDLAGSLEAWGVAPQDSADIRISVAAIRSAVLLRQFNFAKLLLDDLEAVKSPIITFVKLLNQQAKFDQAINLARQLLTPAADKSDLDWEGAASQLLAKSLSEISDRLAQQVPVPAAQEMDK